MGLVMWLAQLRRFRVSDMDYLSQKYLALLRRRYGLSPDAVSNAPPLELWPELAAITDLSLVPAAVTAKMMPASPRLLNNYWNQLLGNLMEVLDPRLATNIAVFIGEVPDGRFNASTAGQNKRHLVLIQSGLELFLYRMALIIVGSMRLRFNQTDGSSTVVEPEMGMAAARAEVRANLAGLPAGRHRMPIALQSPAMLRIAPFLAYAMQQFVIAHELGHIAQSAWRRHPPDDPRERAMIARAAQLPGSGWREEAVCDMFAADLCEKLLARTGERFGLDDALARRILVEAPHIVFMFLQVLELVAASRDRRSLSHPPAAERSRILIEHQCAHGVSPTERDLVAERCQHVAILAGLAG